MDRNKRVRIMKQYVERYKNHNPRNPDIRIESNDYNLIMTLKRLGYFNNEAFNVEFDNQEVTYMAFKPFVYPLTTTGENYLSTGWYYRYLKSSSIYHIIRDIFGYFGGAIASYFMLSKLYHALFEVVKSNNL